jgi:hypothetical protein
MKIRFGEFPEHHHFLLLTRPFVEGAFKFFGWLAFTATAQVGYELTHNKFLFVLAIFCNLLLLAFVGAFVDWIFSFQRDKGAAGNSSASQSENERSSFRKFEVRFRKWIVSVVAIAIWLSAMGISNFIADKLIDGFIEIQQKAKSP